MLRDAEAMVEIEVRGGVEANDGSEALDVTVRSMDHPLHSGMWGGAVVDPVQALLKLNDGTNFVTAALFRQVLAYKSLGQDSAAAALAQRRVPMRRWPAPTPAHRHSPRAWLAGSRPAFKTAGSRPWVPC